MANEGVEMVEMTRPWDAVQGPSGRPQPVAPAAGEFAEARKRSSVG